MIKYDKKYIYNYVNMVNLSYAFLIHLIIFNSNTWILKKKDTRVYILI